MHAIILVFELNKPDIVTIHKHVQILVYLWHCYQ